VVRQRKDGCNSQISCAIRVSLSPPAFAQRPLGFPCWLVGLQLKQGGCWHLSGFSGPNLGASLLAAADQELCLQNIACQSTRAAEVADRYRSSDRWRKIVHAKRKSVRPFVHQYR
jgi:hypothetical protein